jgi:uncharacterized protein
MPIASDIGTASAPAVLVSIKAVPGAKRDEVVGRLGDRLKVRVGVPPEAGKANTAICQLLARELGVRVQDIEVTRGHTNPEKTVRITGVRASGIETRWPT